MEMRQAFAEKLDELMGRDQRICVVDADLARASGTLFLREKYPDRAFDVGVAEANMASVAAGLAAYGLIPFITSFATFASRRIADQAMISIAYAQRSVKIVGTDPGICAELNGGTHMPFEDMSIMCAIPGMLCLEPSDAVQAAQAVEQVAAYEGPVYIRLARKVQPDIHDDNYRFDLFRADVLREGTDVTILSSGILVSRALEAAVLLEAEGVSAEVIDVHTWKPLDEASVLASVKKTGAVVTAENHNYFGGLNAVVCGLLCKNHPVPVERISTEDRFGQVGKLKELAEAYGFTAENIAAKAKAAAARK